MTIGLRNQAEDDSQETTSLPSTTSITSCSTSPQFSSRLALEQLLLPPGAFSSRRLGPSRLSCAIVRRAWISLTQGSSGRIDYLNRLIMAAMAHANETGRSW